LSDSLPDASLLEKPFVTKVENWAVDYGRFSKKWKIRATLFGQSASKGEWDFFPPRETETGPNGF
jgi:hypothetical protein